jgi:hypothetical protein
MNINTAIAAAYHEQRSGACIDVRLAGRSIRNYCEKKIKILKDCIEIEVASSTEVQIYG